MSFVITLEYLEMIKEQVINELKGVDAKLKPWTFKLLMQKWNQIENEIAARTGGFSYHKEGEGIIK